MDGSCQPPARPSGPARWLRIIAFGLALGLLLVAADLTVVHYVERFSVGAPFALSADGVKNDVTGVIDAQLAAFRRDDFAGAYAFADSDLKRQFDPVLFAAMVRADYPAIAASRHSNFGMIFDNGRLAVVLVAISGPTGPAEHFQYVLRRENRRWRVSAVTRLHLTQDLV